MSGTFSGEAPSQSDQQASPLPGVTVFVIEPDDLQRRQICASISGLPQLVLVGEAPRLDSEASDAAPDLLLANSSLLPDQNADLCNLIQHYSGLRIVFFNSRPSIETLLAARDLPVCGLLSLNHLSTDEFARSLVTIAHGGAVIEPLSAMDLLAHLRRQSPATPVAPLAPAMPLTNREAQVLAYVREGLANKEIASRSNMSLGTVRAHLRAIFRKLNVNSRTGAAMMAASMPLHSPQARPEPRTRESKAKAPGASLMSRSTLSTQRRQLHSA